MKKEHVQLTDTDRETLVAMLAKGSLKARVFKRATGLLALERGQTLGDVAQTLQLNYNTVATLRERYASQGLEALYDKARTGRPIEIDGVARAKVTALACSKAPTGHAGWSLRLLAEHAVTLEYCEHLSHTQVRHILKKTRSSRTCAEPGVSRRSMRFF